MTRSLVVILSVLLLPACGGNPGPGPIPPEPTPEPTPPYTAACQELLDQGLPWCHDVSPPLTCGECVHNPSGDPRHCEKAPDCNEPPPPELPEPQCSTFMDRGGTIQLTSGECDCYRETVWIPCPDPPQPTECGFPQGIPEDDFTYDPNGQGTLGSVINATMSDMTGCSVGSDCPITFAPDVWMHLVCDKLCNERSLNCGRHIDQTPGGTDQISVIVGSFCDGRPHQQYQIFNYGGGKVRWAPGGSQGTYTVSCTDQPPPSPQNCTDPDPRGLSARFDCHRVGNGNKIDCTYKVTVREYCEQVCSPIEPDVCFTGRNKCPMRMEGDPERHVCYEAVVAPQKWWCNGQEIESTENPAQAVCSGPARTCTGDGATCQEIPPR